MAVKKRMVRFDDTIDLVKVTTDSNEYSDEGVKVREVVGSATCNVELMTGSRLMYFQSKGYRQPVTIRLFTPEVEYNEVEWQGKQLVIKSNDIDKDNTMITVITADIIDEKV